MRSFTRRVVPSPSSHATSLVFKMLIPINIALSTSSPLPPQLAKLGNDELVLIELQGSLDVECTDNNERNGQAVGKFKLEEGSVSTLSLQLFEWRLILVRQSKPTLVIGHHLLEGKIVSLNKPLGILQRCIPPSLPMASNSDLDDAMEFEVEDAVSNRVEAGATGWDMIAIVKKKIVFEKRPMPIVTSMGAAPSNVNKAT